MIRTESLTKFFGSRCAVDDFDVQIAHGQIVGFLGLNGAGKTTTLRMLSGLLAPSRGRVLVDGEDLAGPGGARVRARIGFLPDRPPVYDEMSVEGFLTFAARLRGHPGGPARVEEVLERTGLSHYSTAPITTLSHGYRQRVGIAQAIVHDPVLVILDEPTSGLDPQQIVEMRTLIQSLGEHHTVLLSSHNLTDVRETCDQILLIDEGRLQAQGTPEELAAKMGTESALELTVVGAQDAVRSVMEDARTRGVVKSWTATDWGESSHELRALSPQSPEELAKHLIEAGLGLRRLNAARNQLEGLFAELTKRAS